MNMELNQTVECTFFASAFNVNDLQITTLDQYIDQIRSKKYASAITRLRAEYLAGHTEEGDKRKKKLPQLVPARSAYPFPHTLIGNHRCTTRKIQLGEFGHSIRSFVICFFAIHFFHKS